MKFFDKEIETQENSDRFYSEITGGAYQLGTIVDLGANIGIFSFWIAPFAKKVYSVEPEPEAFALLEKNIKTLNLGTVLPFKLAISGKSEKRRLFTNGANGGASIVNSQDNFIETESLSLGEFLIQNRINQVDLLKIDVEGAEKEIFEAPDFPGDKISIIVGEMHGYNPTAVLEKYGFKMGVDNYFIARK